LGGWLGGKGVFLVRRDLGMGNPKDLGWGFLGGFGNKFKFGKRIFEGVPLLGEIRGF